jgi:acyl-CoA synthetase (NDP forming)
VQKSDKPLLVYVSPDAPRIVCHLGREGVPAFSAPESCAAALAAMLAARTGSTSQADSPPAHVLSSVAALEGLPRSGPLNEAESKLLFARFGIASASGEVVATPADAARAAHRIGGNVVLKILSRHIAHKTEIGGVIVDVAPEDVARRCTELAAIARSGVAPPVEGFLVQEFVRDGAQVILGFYRDAQLGPAVLLGMGGVAAELFNDTVIRLAPISRRNADDMIDELRGAPLLRGFRGREPYDVEALAQAMVAFSNMAASLGERLREAEINPLFVLPVGRGVRAADGLVILQDGD